MLALFRTFSWEYLRHHPWRSAAAVVAVMLGVALAFAVHVINASALDEFSQAVRAVNGQPDVEVRPVRGSLPEALFEDRVVQNFPIYYDYNDEYFRFSVSGQMFGQGAKPGSAKWNEVLESFLALGFTFVPTFTIYDANRDLMRARQADWHKDYTWKSMWDYFSP